MEAHSKIAYHAYVHKKTLFCIACILGTFLVLGLDMSSGKYDIGFFESYQILWDHITGNIATDDIGMMKDHVIWDMRVPRAIAGLFVGAGLGICGTVMQSALKNPLADPYTTGISAGASLGATVAIIMGVSIIPGLGFQETIILNAFVFSLIPAGIMILFSTLRRNMTPASTILVGVAVMYVFSATTMLIKVSATEEALAEAYIWSIGTLGKATWDSILPLGLSALIGTGLFCLMSNMLNVLAMKDNNVIALGENPRNMRLIFMIVVSLVTASLVCYTGTIGFVGLVAPHIVRLIIGSDNRYLVPASACFGALFLMGADCIAKELTMTGLPVGVVTAMVGGPLFILILIKMRKTAW